MGRRKGSAQPANDVQPVWTIYCHTNRVNGKRYVGQTKWTMEERWRSHVKDARSGTTYYFHRAIRKYGSDAFDHEVLEACASKCAADDAERKWIASYMSNDSLFGYNLESGGTSGKVVSEASREKNRSARTTAQRKESARAFTHDVPDLDILRSWMSDWEQENGRRMSQAKYDSIRSNVGGPLASKFMLKYGITFRHARDGEDARDLSGQVFGLWTVSERRRARPVKHGTCVEWLCICSCEQKTERWISTSSLRSKNSRSCGCASVQWRVEARTRRYRLDNGDELSATEMSARTGLTVGAIYLRIKNGWSPQRIVDTKDARLEPKMNADALRARGVATSLGHARRTPEQKSDTKAKHQRLAEARRQRNLELGATMPPEEIRRSILIMGGLKSASEATGFSKQYLSGCGTGTHLPSVRLCDAIRGALKSRAAA